MSSPTVALTTLLGSQQRNRSFWANIFELDILRDPIGQCRHSRRVSWLWRFKGGLANSGDLKFTDSRIRELIADCRRPSLRTNYFIRMIKIWAVEESVFSCRPFAVMSTHLDGYRRTVGQCVRQVTSCSSNFQVPAGVSDESWPPFGDRLKERSVCVIHSWFYSKIRPAILFGE